MYLEDPIAPQTSQARAVLERHFSQGLEFVSQSFKQMKKLSDRMGPGSQPAKKMLGEAMDQLVQAVREFNECIEHLRSSGSRDAEIDEANRLLQEYRQELEEMRRKNKQLREIVALRIDSRFPEDRFEEEAQARPLQRPRPQSSHLNADFGRADDVTFGKRGRPGKIPEEMLKSTYTQNGFRSPHHDESLGEKHNKSWMSINLDRGLDRHFLKKDKPGLASQASASKSPTRLAELSGPAEARPQRDSLMKRSLPLGAGPAPDQELLRSVGAESSPKHLREEISEIDRRIFELVSHIFDQYQSEHKADL